MAIWPESNKYQNLKEIHDTGAGIIGATERGMDVR